MDKLLLNTNLFQATATDWIKSIPMDLECYVKELYTQISIKPLYDENRSNILSLINGTKNVQLIEEKNHTQNFISTREFHQKGASIIQEIGYTLALLSDILHGKEKDEIDQFIKELQLEVYIDTDFFGSISKLQVFRLLLPTILKEFITDENMTIEIPIKAVTSTRTITKEEPQLNLIRKTVEVIAGMIGEANFIELIPYENTEDAKRWSENIFHLLNHESKLKEIGNIVEGCYYLEELTQELSVGAWDLFLQIESNGGYSEYIENGEVEKEIAAEREKSIEKMMLGEVKLVGLNSFRRHEPNQFSKKDYDEFNQESEIYHFSNWIEKCHQLANASWDCLILEGASEQEEELMKNVLFTLHSIGLKNKIDADVLFIAGDEKKVNFFQLMNPKKRLVRIVEEVSEDEKYSMSEITQLPELINELMNVEVQK